MRHRRTGKRSLARQAFDAVSSAREVRRRTGKAVLSQAIEMALLMRVPNRVTPDEYFAMRLFDDAHLDWAGKLTFLGKRAKPHVYRINHPGWRALADDKLACLAQLTAYGLPLARTVAIHTSTAKRVFPGARAFSTLDEVAAFLRHDAPYPLFSKPNAGTLGWRGYAITAYDDRSDELLTSSEERISMSSYLSTVIAKSPGGTLFQQLIAPHPELGAICGGRLGTVRALVLNDGAQQFLHRAVWRIPTGANMVDNFRHGQLGNLLASLDPADGRVQRVVAGVGLGLHEVERHPDTNYPFAGLRLPDWERVIELCRAASAIMSGIRIQGWDIALSDRGPLLIELNFLSDFDLLQLAHVRGVADVEWRRFLAAHG